MAFVEPTKFTWVVDENGKKRKKAARDTSWRARYIDPSGHARGKTFPRKYDAEQFLAQNTTSIQQGDWADPALKRTRFSEWADMWWATTPKLAPSTRRGYERMLRIYIRPVFNDRPIASIDWNEVELFIAKLVNENLSPKTVRHAVSVLTLVMQTAMRSKAIRENPAVGHTINIPRTRPNVLTMEQVHRSSITPTSDTSLSSGCSYSQGCGPPNYAAYARATSTGNGTRSRSTKYRCRFAVSLS
jgi:hypothetical protein